MMTEFSGTYWVYCDKKTGRPVTCGKRKALHLMLSRPTADQVRSYGHGYGITCVTRQVTLTAAGETPVPVQPKLSRHRLPPKS